MRSVFVGYIEDSNEPVTLDQIKHDLRVAFDGDADNDQLERNIAEARGYVEDLIERKLRLQEWRYYLDRFPPSVSYIDLPETPVREVTSITYYDAENVESDWPSENNWYVTGNRLVAITQWPVSYARDDAVVVRYTAGYDVDDEGTSTIEEPIKAAIRLKVAELYDGADNDAAINRLLWRYLKMKA